MIIDWFSPNTERRRRKPTARGVEWKMQRIALANWRVGICRVTVIPVALGFGMEHRVTVGAAVAPPTAASPAAPEATLPLDELPLTLLSCTSECKPFTVASMLCQKKVWCSMRSTPRNTTGMSSFVVEIPAGATVLGLDVASTGRLVENRVQELQTTRARPGVKRAKAGVKVGATLASWAHFGAERPANTLKRARETIGGFACDGFIAERRDVQSRARRFKVSARQARDAASCGSPGVAVFRLLGRLQPASENNETTSTASKE